MTLAATFSQTNPALLGAVLTWRQSVELVQHLVDRGLQDGPHTLTQSDHDDFAAALRALYVLEATIFPIDERQLPIAA